MENKNMTGQMSGGNVQTEDTQRTFTQEQVNEIVKERLSRYKKNNDSGSSLQEKEDELDAREKLLDAREKLVASNLPVSLMDMFNNDKTIDEKINVLKSYIDESGQGKRKIIENRLPDRGNEEDIGNSIRAAMGLR